MTRHVFACALAAAASTAVSGIASAAVLPFSTGFEAAEGYANASQLSANAPPNWTGDGQDTTAWAVTNSVVNGLGPKTGSQWVLVTAPTSTARSRTQWVVASVGNLAAQPVITGSADVRLIAPASGTLNRTTSASIAMIDDDLFMIATLSLIVDSENLFGFGANHTLLQFYSFGVSQKVYDLAATPDLTHYYALSLTADYAAGTYRGSVNGTLLDYVGSLQGATTFREFDLQCDARTSTSSGQRARAGFDNYSITQTPTPGAAALLGLAGGVVVRRRRR